MAKFFLFPHHFITYSSMTPSLEELFGCTKPIIGMVHLPPLPNSPKYQGNKVELILEHALRDAEALKEGGVDGVQVENIGDKPFMKPGQITDETTAIVAIVAREVRKATGLPTGVFILANGIEESISAAAASGAKWIRANMYNLAYIADEGLVESAAPKAERRKTNLRADVKIFADVLVKHGSHFLTQDLPLEYKVRRLEETGAEAIIVSGERTGAETPAERVKQVKQTATKPVLIGSGLTPENATTLLKTADGAIVGTYLKKEGKLQNPIDPERVKRLVNVVKRLRKVL